MADEPKDQLKDAHHDFDGIQEYDNDLPRWWLWLFYLTIAWSIWYIPFYHGGGGKVGADELRDDLKALAVQRAALDTGGPVTEDSLRLVAAAAPRIAHGGELYVKLGCVACHAADGTGGVGPNLRDRFWIYGSRMTEIHDIIAKGRAGSGMNGYQNLASGSDLADLTAYVVSLNREGLKPGKPGNPAREKDAPVDY